MKAPSWGAVFAFGLLWNAVIEPNWLGVLVCSARVAAHSAYRLWG
jgi:hypothetical protein